METMKCRPVMAKQIKEERIYISWVTKEATSIRNSHSSVTQEINQVLN